MRICIVITTRGNYAKFNRIMGIAANDSFFKVQVVTGGEVILHERAMEFKFLRPPDAVAHFNLYGDSLKVMGKSLGLAVGEFCEIFDSLKPDVVMLVGDRFETFGAATAAFTLGIPIAHLEGGEVTGTLDNAYRYAITEMAEYHFPCTELAGFNLYRKGKTNVKVVGATSIDFMIDSGCKSDMTELQKTSGSGAFIDVTKPYIVAIYHPDTECLMLIKGEIDALIKAIDDVEIPTFLINSNIDAGHDIIGSALRRYRDEDPSHVRFLKSVPIQTFSFLLKNASCMVGNSSAGVREASFFGIPNVTIGDRQQGREKAENTIDCVLNNVADTIVEQINHGKYEPSALYGNGTASEKILQALKEVLL